MGGFREYNEIPAWTATLGDLLQARVELVAVCSRCTPSRKADLNRMIAAKGPLYSLWNRTTRCTRPGCDGRVWFYASRIGANVWPVKMKNARPHQAKELHDAWKASGWNAALQAGRPRPFP